MKENNMRANEGGGDPRESPGKEVEVVWYGHVVRREEHYVGRRAMEMKLQGIRKRGRPRKRWLDKVKADISENGLPASEVCDRETSYIDPP